MSTTPGGSGGRSAKDNLVHVSDVVEVVDVGDALRFALVTPEGQQYLTMSLATVDKLVTLLMQAHHGGKRLRTAPPQGSA